MGNLEKKSRHRTLETLCRNIARWAGTVGYYTTAIPDLSVFRREAPMGPMSVVYEPSICQLRLSRRVRASSTPL